MGNAQKFGLRKIPPWNWPLKGRRDSFLAFGSLNARGARSYRARRTSIPDFTPDGSPRTLQMAARRDASSRVGAAIGQSPSQSQRSSLAKKIARFERADENSRATQKFDGSMGEETARLVGARPAARQSGKTPLKVRRFAILGHPSPLSRLSHNRCAHSLSHPSAAKRDDALTRPSPPSQSGNNANRSLSGSPIVSKALAALDAASRGEDLTDSDDDDARSNQTLAITSPSDGRSGGEAEEESEDDAARRIQTWFRGYKSRREESETKVREMMAEKRRTLERIARARDEDRRAKRSAAKPSTPADAADAATPERPVWPEDAPAPASASPIGGGFKSFVRDVAARVIQRGVRVIHRREANPKNARSSRRAGGDAGERPARGRRSRAVPPRGRRGTSGETGTGEASPAQTSSRPQTSSSSPEQTPAAVARAAPRAVAGDGATRDAAAAPTFPGGEPAGTGSTPLPGTGARASVSDDTLASIMSYLDAVENEGAVPTHHAAGGTSLAHHHAPSSSTARRVVPEWVRSGFSAPTHSHPPAREEGPAAGRFGLAAVLSQYRPQTPIPGLADEETSASDGGVALATATNVYEGVRARMDAMKSELQRRDKLVAKLEAELRIAYDRAAAQTAQQLQDQRQAHETATQRHLDFAERLLKDKDELAGRCAELSESLAAAEARHASQSAEMKAAYGEQLKKAKQKWDEAQAKWESEKTLEIKEMTIRGLEPEIQRLVQKHRNEVGDLIEKHREETRRLESHLTTKHEDAMRALRAEMNAQFEEELERERASGAARLRDQAERHEQSMKTFRERAAADGASGTEMYEKGRREEREKYEQVVQRLNEEHTRREERMADQAAASADAVRRRHDADARRCKPGSIKSPRRGARRSPPRLRRRCASAKRRSRLARSPSEIGRSRRSPRG